MTKTIQKIEGAAKEVAAEIPGDKNLQDEGKQERRTAATDRER
ncbi:hypothetical protein AFEL58S_00936 [Afipia felis]